jgi:hypothetical protein
MNVAEMLFKLHYTTTNLHVIRILCLLYLDHRRPCFNIYYSYNVGSVGKVF